MTASRDGIVLLDKRERESSFSVVRDVRRILLEKKVGHAGTLDPFATGLLVILLGRGTKLCPFLMGMDKEYEAVLRLGVETDTLDPTGRVVRTCDVSALEPEFIREVASTFVGRIEQVPPSFSAVRCRGKRAYELARKGVCPDLQKRVVHIHRLEITCVDLPYLSLSVRCSKGTYIRTLGAELGQRLGPGAHLSSLRRISSGPFQVVDAIGLKPETSREELQARIIPLRDALPHLREVEVSRDTCELIEKGFPSSRWAGEVLSGIQDSLDCPIKLITEGRLLAILKPPARGQECLELMRVFA